MNFRGDICVLGGESENCNCPEMVTCHYCSQRLCSCIGGARHFIGHYHLHVSRRSDEVPCCVACYPKHRSDSFIPMPGLPHC